MKAEIVVIGGGPAGSAFAIGMAHLGHRVLIVERLAFPRPHVGEVLTPGTWPLLDTLDVRAAVEAQGFLRTTTSLVRWADSEPRVVSGAEAPLLNVDRGRFDEILLAAARAAGVSILQPATAGCPKRTDEGWEVPVTTLRERVLIQSHFLADASGRSVVLRGARRRTSAHTIALCGSWRVAKQREVTTRIETMPDGWCWGAHVAADTFRAMAFVDSGLLREQDVTRSGLERFYRRLVHSSGLLNGLENAQPQADVFVCDATCYADADPVGETFIKLGEAAFAIDPLSSTGVQKALQTSLSGSVVAHTLISGDGDGSAALEFYRENQRYSVERHATWAGEYYSQNILHRQRPFWHKRAKAPLALRSTSPRHTLRELLSHRVILSADASIRTSPCIVGHIVERCPTLYHPSLGRPVAYLDGMELARLLKPVESGLTLDQILTIWSKEIPTGRALAIADWLNHRGIIVRAPM